jgi:hypothetical protein
MRTEIWKILISFDPNVILLNKIFMIMFWNRKWNLIRLIGQCRNFFNAMRKVGAEIHHSKNSATILGSKWPFFQKSLVNLSPNNNVLASGQSKCKFPQILIRTFKLCSSMTIQICKLISEPFTYTLFIDDPDSLQ